MAAPKEILDLRERFDRNREAYLSGNSNETQLRREFVDPFFKNLGWDVENTAVMLRPTRTSSTKTPSKKERTRHG